MKDKRCHGIFFLSLKKSFLIKILKEEVNGSFIGEAGTSNYMGYILVGVLVYSFTVSTLLNVSRSLITEKRIGTLESVMLAPYNRGLYFLAYMVAQTIHTFGELILQYQYWYYLK